MNKYDKKIFKQHYGRLYFQIMYWGLGLALLSVQIAYYPGFFGYEMPNAYIGFWATVVVLSCIGVGVAGYLYFYCKDKAQNQQVWIDGRNVCLRLEKGTEKKPHTITYTVKQANACSLSTRYINIKGKIHVIDERGAVEKQSYIKELKIPRCFSNEEKVLKALRII